ncbi:MAG: glutamine synthetase family protein [Deltaproteobacteria bacterium]
MNLQDLEELVLTEEVDTVIVGFTDLYGRLMGKRCDAEYFLTDVAKAGTHSCDYLLAADMEMEPVPGYAFANWERGYGDVHLVPDMDTLRLCSWLDRTAMIFCDVHDVTTHEPVAVSPRQILRRQLAAAKELGFDVLAASELEYFIFETSYRAATESNFQNLQAAGWYLEDYHIFQGSRVEKLNAEARRHLRRSGVPVETTKGEWGLGQHELNIRYAEALTMADRHIVLKQCVREIADQLEMSVTFMAKFAAEQAGSSCHVHMSLWRDGVNAFAGDEAFGKVRGSAAFGSFLAGWQAHAAEMMAFYAPTVNSYKRYQPGSWSLTRIAWSQDNRTAGFRVVGADQSLRVECRIPGADVNPYLVFAAAIASGLDGLRRGLAPEAPFEGDVYAATELPEVPMSLRDATDRFTQSDFVREAFGDQVVDHYTHFFRVEEAAHHAAVSDWERQRYFERI